MKSEARTSQMLALAIALFATTAVAAQVAVETSANPTVVPQITRFSGVMPGRPAGTVELVFRIYAAAEGGEALWTETQQVALGADGKYSVLLGAVAESALPPSVFASGQARWLSVSIAGAPEQVRVPLDSAAYAMKAADAETLGGLPAADFVTQTQFRAHPFPLPVTPGASPKSSKAVHPNDPGGSGTANTIAMWTDSGTLGNSAVTQKQTQSGTDISVGGNLNAGSIGGWTNSTTPFSAAVYANEGAPTGQVFGVMGTVSSTTNNAAGMRGMANSATGAVFGVNGQTNSSTNGAAGVDGLEGAVTGAVFGVLGNANSSTSGAAGVSGYEGAATGQVYGVVGSTSSTSGTGVVGNEWSATGSVVGVSGSTISSAGTGVMGSEWNGTGKVYGVVGQTASSGTDAAGVMGGNWGNSGITFGVIGYSGSVTAGAAGVEGTALATTGAVSGVLGNSPSTAGTGVLGVASSKTGSTVGVSGQSASPTGIGVLGETTAAGATAGKFINGAGSGLILEGVANTAKVFSVDSAGTGTFSGSGIFTGNGSFGGSGSFGNGLTVAGSGLTVETIAAGKATKHFSIDASGNAIVSGSLTVTGKLVKGSGSFKIDHPLDPANKYLSHSFVESPDMMNVYNGNIVTDRRGLATVALPDYFEALNRDFRYQLTVIGQFAQAIVARKVAGNRFVIRTSKPGVEVSWQVTGIRQDAYANSDRIPVEEQKPAGERGYYLHPEAFGQPPSRSVMAAGQPQPQPGATQASSR